VEEKTVFQPRPFGSVRPGTRLNGIYEIEKLIAQGGMGEVYRGFNIQTGDIVAIKMIRPEFSNNEEMMELFRREASILHNLVHEAIVRYFLFSVDPEVGRAYLAMEFVDGPSLSDRLTSGPLSLPEVTILRKRMASALETAHRLGVVHRDMSSDNVILPNGDVRNAKIIDFGIARAAQLGKQTIVGSGFAGKYNYVSPEQLGLEGGDVTFKSDIYSLGLVLAEATRGHALDMSGSQVAVIEKRRVVPDLSDVDASVRSLLEAMLQPAPENRPASMAAVAEWTEPAAAPAPTPTRTAREPTKPAAAAPARESRGGRLAAIVGAAIAVASLSGVAFVFKDDLAQWTRRPRAAAPPIVAPSSPPLAATPAPEASNPPPDALAASAKLPPLAAPPVASQTPPVAAPPPAPPAAEETAPQASKEESPPPASPPPAERAPAAGEPEQPTPSAEKPAAPAPAVQPPAHSEQAAPLEAPRPSLPAASLDAATVGQDYSAALPSFSSAGGAPMTLRADPAPPSGLAFADLGSGYSQISGKPTAAGSYAFDVIATNAAGLASRTSVTLTVAPAAAAPAKAEPSPQAMAKAEPPTRDERAAAFVRSFDGGECFLVKALPGGGGRGYLGLGDQLAPFQRFEEEFRKEVGAEPQLSLRLIAPPECAALDLLRPGADDSSSAPRVTLADYRVGRNKPLSGAVANLAGRPLFLLLVDNQGKAYRIDAKTQPGGDSATFSIPLIPDAGSVGPIQLVMAVAPAKPIPALESFRSGELKALAPAIADEAKSGAAAVGADFFTFVN